MDSKLVLALGSSVFVLIILGGVIFFLKNASNDNIPTLNRNSPMSGSELKSVDDADVKSTAEVTTTEEPILPDVTSDEPLVVGDLEQGNKPTADPLTLGTKISDKYFNYSDAILATALSQNQRVLLYFYASWCPTCRMVEKDIIANNSQLPVNVMILKVDYDVAIDLKTKYAVEVQDTFIQLNNRGLEIKRWTGGNVSTINENLR